MPRRLTIVQGHPDPAGNRFCHALADAYAEGAAAAGHQATRVDVAHLDFPILRTQQDFEHGQLPETLVEALMQLDAPKMMVDRVCHRASPRIWV